MARWDADVEPVGCPGLAGVACAACAAAAVAPWVAGAEPFLAAVLSVACLLALRDALRALPGRAAAIRRLRVVGGAWTVTLADGTERRAEPLRASLVLPGFAFCRVRVAGQKLDWWVPGYAVSAAGFRCLKVALRCQRRWAHDGLLDSSLSRHEEAARGGSFSRAAN